MPPSPRAGAGRGGEPLPMEEIVKCLSEVVFNKAKRGALSKLRDNDAQSMIDYLNMLSSHPNFLQLAEPKLRKHTLIVLDGGGFCDIFQGRYQGHNLCLKVVRLYQKRDQDKILKAHAREAILWSRLEHPNITPFYGIFYLEEMHKRICLLSPWMENGNIVEYLKRERQVPRRPFLHDIASGLEYLHSEKIVHGDLKGVNVLVDESLTACLTDFGVSKILTERTLGFTKTTNPAPGFTTGWASPELLEDNARPTRESDIWAFGCVCYEVLTGLPPFQGCTTEAQVVLKLMRGNLPAQSAENRLDPDDVVNEEIWGLVKQCWSFDAKQRPKCREILQTMEENPILWQIRAGGLKHHANGSRQFQYKAGTSNHSLDHSQAKLCLEKLMRGFQESAAVIKEEESQVVDRIHSAGPLALTSGNFRSPKSLRPQSLQSPPLIPSRVNSQDLMSATNTPCRTLSPAALLRSLSRPLSVKFGILKQDIGTTSATGGPKSHEPDMFNQAYNCSVTGNFIDGNGALNSTSPPPRNFMEKLLQETMQGATTDSSICYTPPRCQRGTREATINRCIHFILNCNGVKKMLWVVGAAAVGKSAVMQSVAASEALVLNSRALVHFSVNRHRGTRIIITIAHQLATNYEPYRQYIEAEIARDPSLLESSMTMQFNKLIAEPFIYHPQLSSAARILIIIDGLNECDDSHTQLEILHLISGFCLMYPSSPLVWFIASRPEPHIVSFFSRNDVISAYEKEGILVDSDEARRDVERFLRRELMEIKHASNSLALLEEWPEDRDFWKLAKASDGLFACARIAINYIGDLTFGNPTSRFSEVLNVIDEHPMPELSQDQRPVAFLDALYAQILSNIPTRVRMITEELLLALTSDWVYGREAFLVLCNWLGVTSDEAYAAIGHLHSFSHAPGRSRAYVERLKIPPEPFMIINFFSSSKLYPEVGRKCRHMDAQCALRIIQEAHDGIDFGDVDYNTTFGVLARGPGTGSRISLSWLVDEKVDWDNDRTRLNMYKLAVQRVLLEIERGEQNFQHESCIRFLAARFKTYSSHFPYNQIFDLVFEESRRYEFTSLGVIKQMPLKVIKLARIDKAVNLQFRRPATAANHRQTDPRSLSCKHKWKESLEAAVQTWTTEFSTADCNFCYRRFKRLFWKARFTPLMCTALFSSTGECCVELEFVGSRDGIRCEWTYRFCCALPLKKRRKYGSTV